MTAVDDDGPVVKVDLGGHLARLVLGGPADERFNPPDDAGVRKPPSARFAVGDVVRVQRAPDDDAGRHQVALAGGAEGAVVVIDVATREVQALVGGYAVSPLGFDRATTAERQPGSSFKPFVYGAAIASGRFTPASIINDAPEVFDLWRPKNYNADKFEGPVTLRHALAKSTNTVAIRVAYELTPDAVVDFARAAGIPRDLPRHLSIDAHPARSRRSSSPTRWRRSSPAASTRRRGAVRRRRADQAAGAGGGDVAGGGLRGVVDLVRSVVSRAPRRPNNWASLAGKTSTSNDNRDAWFVD
ncbi:MAG: penicillin-binding transpeptidase domain-containing protein [Kofleriaceae bacterium]